MGIRDNGGGDDGVSSGVGSSADKNCGVWCGFIVDKNGLVRSVIMSVGFKNIFLTNNQTK